MFDDLPIPQDDHSVRAQDSSWVVSDDKKRLTCLSAGFYRISYGILAFNVERRGGLVEHQKNGVR